MTTFGPVSDLFASREDRLRLLDAHKIKLARLDVFQQHEKEFQNSVLVARQSFQEEQSSRLAQQKIASEMLAENQTSQTIAKEIQPSSQENTMQPTTKAEPSVLTVSPILATKPEHPTTKIAETTTQESLDKKLEERLKTVATQNESQKEERKLATTEDTDTANPLSSSVFANVMDVLNPLQHIPFVNLAYREISGDTIAPGSKVAGGVLFGGLLGGVGSVSALTGAGIGAASGVADATFTNVSRMETSEAVARLYKGEPFSGEAEEAITAQQLGPSSNSIRDESITFDARHMYSDVLKKFGTDIDILLAQNPENYGAEVVYASTMAHMGSMSSQTIQARLPGKTDPSNQKDVLARLHTPADNITKIANVAPTHENKPYAILSKAPPLEMKKDALERLARVRAQIEERDEALNANPEHNSVNDIASMIERRLSQLIDLRNNTTTQQSTTTVSMTTPANPDTSKIANPEKLVENVNADASERTPIANVQPATTPTSDPLADKMQERLNAFQQRQEQRIINDTSESVTTLPQIPNPVITPSQADKVSQNSLLSANTSLAGLSSAPNESLASAMRDVFSRFRNQSVAQK